MHGIFRRDFTDANDGAPSLALLPAEIESATTRKIRIRVIPFVFVLFVIAFIDRINIGFAALTMEQGIGHHEPTVRVTFWIIFLGILHI